ncbi:hypothetical protein AB835_01675 [Candidatus Endobugula sertula]|uniref:Glycosyltransferase n=1 Tax=Candidatus Endobugula sertula TaxID=62101 RepID=A0A1D2QT80_9GAMM|nr:hypothetical protein AB835_01675 [Candidatus Endobugula sertula]
MQKKVNVICMKWGNKFSSEYVNKLYGMIARNLTIPFRFICFTEVSVEIKSEVEIQHLPEINLPANISERGWKKLSVLSENFGNLTGKTLFLNLDVVIIQNIDCFFLTQETF